MTCQACTTAQEAKRAAIVATPITKPNPRWLKRFQDKARDLLLQRDFYECSGVTNPAWTSAFGEELHVGEVWFKGNGYRTDEHIIEEACKRADWMRWKAPTAHNMSMPTFSSPNGVMTYPQRTEYSEEKRAVKVERMIPDPDGEAKVAYLRCQMPDKCAMHLELDALMAENIRLKGQQATTAVKKYVKLSQQYAKLTGQELSGTVRIVTFEPQGKQPVQGEVFKPALKPLVQRNRAAELAAIAAAKITRL